MAFNLNKMINDIEKKNERKKRIEAQKNALRAFVNDGKLGKITNDEINSGGCGLIAEIKADDNSIYAAKVQEKNKIVDPENDKKNPNESELVRTFRGPNITKVTTIKNKTIDQKNYELILMERARFNDLSSLVSNLNTNILRLIFKNPFEIVGDNLIRYIVKQLMKGFETLYLANYTHFDFKPGNTLIFDNLVIKLADFGFLRNPYEIADEEKKVNIPGFTHGYIPPEYFYNKDHKIPIEEATKLDYFALGATIYFLKYGEIMMDYPIYKNHISTANYMIKLIERAIDRIKTTKSNDKDFDEFLINLIQYKPKDRISFEQIYRNKWLNKNWNKILEIKDNYMSDEKSLIMELDKSEFLFEKNKYIYEQRKQIDIININGNKDKKISYHKFKLKLQ